MRTPAFWYQPKGVRARLLSPLGAIYAAGTARRLKNGSPFKLDIPVICVGNINAGGTGKTPTTIAIAEHLIARGMTPHIVSRGYGGSLEGPVRVDERKHKASEVGDEPLLLSAFAPVWVAKDRAAGARAAADAGAEMILLDDGHQNPALHKDISIVVADAVRGFGNGCVLPAGPLREPVAAGLARANALLTIGTRKAQDRFAGLNSFPDDLPHLKGQLHPLQTGMDWDGLRVFAFAGIGMPEKSFATLRGLGADLVGQEGLDDHQPFSDALLTRLANQAASLGAQLVTTEKDAVRLPASFRSQVLTVPVRLQIEDWSALDALLDTL
ncbi:MAG: tetraacyldisaccharide 4'-kinase [Litoreibacter sp.]|nr:tetraacyldisaccharide 4'-kinase [Litoreibacter sp.]